MMEPKILDKIGNNAIVVCSECDKVYLVSGFYNNKKPRKCPHCEKTQTRITMKGDTIEMGPAQ